MWNNKQLGWKPLKGFPAQIISPWEDLVHFDARYTTFLPASGDESRIHDSVGGQKWYLHRLHLNSWLSHDVLQLPLTHLSHSRDAATFRAPHKPLWFPRIHSLCRAVASAKDMGKMLRPLNPEELQSCFVGALALTESQKSH